MYRNDFASFEDCREYNHKKRDIVVSEKWNEISSSSNLRIFAGMFFGPTDLFGSKLEMMLEISFLLAEGK